MKIKVGISNHHVHLTNDTLKILFGENYKLEIEHALSQPEEFSSTAKVTLEGPKGRLENVRVVGPTRVYSQVEISKTDSFKLGVNPPVRNSGDLIGSSPITIIGPNGQITLNEGCIISTRHIHISYKDLEKYGLKNKQTVSIKIDSEKSSILEKVYIKAMEKANLELHLDTDDANANMLKQSDEVELIYEQDRDL